MELSGVKKKVLQILLRESVHRAFGRTLLSPVKAVHAIPKGLAFDYKIPPSLCRHQKSQAVLSNAATLALFDEMSTYALFVNDKTTRGGVSVHLNTEIIQPAPLHDDVVIITTADKIGKSLSFCSMEMRNVKGDLLARGKHIKYMPMGWLWDLLAHPLILPWVVIFYQTFHQAKFTTPLDRIVYEPREVSDSEEKVGSVFESLALEKVETLPCEGGPEEVYKIQVKSHLKNRLGLFHGGAAATAIEEACERYLSTFRAKQQHSEQQRLYVEKMEVRYLSSMKGELEIHVSRAQAPFHSNEVLLKGAIVSSKSKATCVEFICSCTRG